MQQRLSTIPYCFKLQMPCIVFWTDAICLLLNDILYCCLITYNTKSYSCLLVVIRCPDTHESLPMVTCW